MNLRISAFGNSPELTLKERANKILNLHRKVCDLVHVYEWKIYNSKTSIIDIRDTTTSYEEIFKQVKSGLNSKVAKPTKYNENDIADITSSCSFYNLDSKGFSAKYSIGFPSKQFPSLFIEIKNITDESIFTESVILNIAKIFIRDWDPYMLCVTDPEYFHEKSKAHELNIPWTGWFTYVSSRLKSLPNNTTFKTQTIDDKGELIWCTDSYFDSKNSYHVKKALELENYFHTAGIDIRKGYT